MASISLEAGVAVVDAPLVVAHRQLELDAGVDQGRHRAHEDVVEAVLDRAVVTDVAEEGHQPERLALVRAGHALGHRHRLAAAAAVVTDGDEREAIGVRGPGVRAQLDRRRRAGDEILASDQAPGLRGDPNGSYGTEGAEPASHELTACEVGQLSGFSLRRIWTDCTERRGHATGRAAGLPSRLCFEGDDVQLHVVERPVLEAPAELTAIRLVQRRREDGPEPSRPVGFHRAGEVRVPPRGGSPGASPRPSR